MLRTDLALETARRLSLNADVEGVGQDIYEDEQAQCEVADITVTTDSAAEKLGRPCGRYITVKSTQGPLDRFSDRFGSRAELIAKLLRELAGGAERILVAGLGNRGLSADAVGPLCADRIFATRHIRGLGPIGEGLTEVSVTEPGVLGRTGLESAEVIKALCSAVEPDLLIAVDSLACLDPDHLGRTVQLCDTGISPGSGVSNPRSELSRRTLGVKVIAVGVPMVMDYPDREDLVITPHNVDLLARNSAEYIAMGINLAFQRELDLNDLRSLI